jgi:hypothetical protein
MAPTEHLASRVILHGGMALQRGEAAKVWIGTRRARRNGWAHHG